MAMSNYPSGFEHGVTIRGVPILNTYTGSVYYVDSVYGSNGHNGTFNWPKASIDYLFLNDIVRAGDIIICKPGHVETLAAASAWDIAGVCIVMDGEGTSKPYFNITATGGYINITGAGITLINPKFVTGIDAVVKGINVAAADFTMCGAEYHDAAGKASTIQVLTTAAADRMVIDGYRYFVSTTGTQKTDGIKTVAGTGIVIKNVQIVGDFSTAPINLSTAAINIALDGLDLNNVNSGPQPAMNIHANTTGFAENVKCRVASGTTYVSDTAKIQWGTMCQGYNTDGSGGVSIGAAADVEAAVDSVGVQASVVDSRVQSVGIRVSVAVSTIASTGIQVSTVDSRVSVGQSKVDSVGVQASLGISITVSTSERVGSVGTQASAVDSRVVSVGVSASIVISQASSIATGAVSVGTQVSVADSRVTSAATSVGIGVSTVSSQVTSAATSVGIGGSTVSSQVTSAATSVGIGVSTVSSQTTSAATSVGIGVSTAVSLAASVGVQVTTTLFRAIRQASTVLAAAGITGTATQFTVTGGPILVRRLGMMVTTVIAAGANTLKFSFTPSGGGATDLSGVTDTAAGAQEQAYLVDGVKATALVKTTDAGIGIDSAHQVGMPLILSNGVIQTIFSAGPPATGACIIFIQWEPLTPTSAVA